MYKQKMHRKQEVINENWNIKKRVNSEKKGNRQTKK